MSITVYAIGGILLHISSNLTFPYDYELAGYGLIGLSTIGILLVIRLKLQDFVLLDNSVHVFDDRRFSSDSNSDSFVLVSLENPPLEPLSESKDLLPRNSASTIRAQRLTSVSKLPLIPETDELESLSDQRSVL